MATACARYRMQLEGAKEAYNACVDDNVLALRGVCDQTLDALAACRVALAASRRFAVSQLRHKLRKKTPEEDGCKGVPLSCKLTPHNVRLLCEPATCMFPTTTTTSTSTTVTTTTAATPTTLSTTASTVQMDSTTTSTVQMDTTPDTETDRCQQRCVNRILKHCFADCVDDCDGDGCALRFCRRGCRNFNCLELRDVCTSAGTHAEDYLACCKHSDTCLDEIECVPPQTTTTSATTSTSTTTTVSTTTTTTIVV